MKSTFSLLLLAILAGTTLFTSGCASQEERTACLERREDAIDKWEAGVRERAKIRAQREDAREEANFNAM